MHYLAEILDRPYAEVKVEFVAWLQTVPVDGEVAIGYAIDRAAAGGPMPWEEDDEQ